MEGTSHQQGWAAAEPQEGIERCLWDEMMAWWAHVGSHGGIVSVSTYTGGSQIVIARDSNG
jgi:hypothetical protein